MTAAPISSALYQSQIWQHAILDSIDNTIIATDHQGIIQTLNANALQKLAYEPEEVIGKIPLIAFHDPQEVVQRAQQLSQELGYAVEPGFEAVVAKARLGIADENTWIQICKDQSRFSVRLTVKALHDDAGSLIGFLGIGKDITEHQKIKQSLHESESRFAGAFEYAAIGMALVSLEGYWLQVNSSVCDVLGYSESELLTLTFQEVTHPDDLELDLNYVEQLLAGEIDNYHLEKRYIHKQGHEVWILLSVSLVRGDDGSPLYFVSQIQNINQRKQAETAFQQLNIDLEQSVHERTVQLENAIETAQIANSAKSDFLAQMSHELRTPLNAILGFSQLIAQDEAMPQHLQNSLDIINRSGKHLLTLVNKVLTLSKIEAGKTTLEETTFSLYELLYSLHEMLQLKAQSQDLKLIVERTADVPEYLYTDEQKLRQILINLLSNALKFTQQGEVTLRVKLNSQDLSSSPPIYHLAFEVEDTGMGIPSDELETIFEPFVQTQAGQHMNQGTGLGLPICRRFIQLMGGELSVSSQLGKGTCFDFDIQARQPEQVVTKGEPDYRRQNRASQQTCYRILVVEDQIENQQLLVDLLTPLGYDVRAVEDGHAAVSLWQDWHPHLIWMDVHLPEMDGLKATRQIKDLATAQSQPSPIIIALTASAFSQTRSQALASGCDDFVSKPYVLADLLEMMTRYLDTQQGYEESQPLPTTRETNTILSHQLTPGLLQGLSSEWKEQLYKAALYLDEEQINGLIKQIELEHFQLACHLTTYVKNFQFDKIIDLAQT